MGPGPPIGRVNLERRGMRMRERGKKAGWTLGWRAGRRARLPEVAPGSPRRGRGGAAAGVGAGLLGMSLLGSLLLPGAAGEHAVRAGFFFPGAASPPAAPAGPFSSVPPLRAPTMVTEADIATLLQAMAEGRVTAREVTEAHLVRIAAYDRTGPHLNAIVRLHPEALARADSLDDHFRRTGTLAGPLHGIPVIIKDNYDVEGLPTTAGSLSLEDWAAPGDAFQVRRLREAGAVLLAKSNMAEFAFSPMETVGSAVPGYTRNPYDPVRVTAGSSGGTAAAVAASFGVVGLGTDTGNSIRGPAAHQGLVGIRSTMGLTSRSGIVPLYLDRDVGGPMARTVEDAVRVLDVIAGSDPRDPVTREADGRLPPHGYQAHLRADGLQGARIGVVRQLSNTDSTDPEVLSRFYEALETLVREGAILVDPVTLPELDEISGPLWCRSFRWDLEAYLEDQQGRAPVRTLAEIVGGGRYHPSIAGRLQSFLAVEGESREENAECREADANARILREGVLRLLRDERLDALVYPTWNNPPRLIGDLNTPDGNNSPYLSPPTGFPAITVPMGHVGERLPVGLQFLAGPWREGRLIELAYAYEQATRHRRPPETTPPVP
jgi:amidase